MLANIFLSSHCFWEEKYLLSILVEKFVGIFQEKYGNLFDSVQNHGKAYKYCWICNFLPTKIIFNERKRKINIGMIGSLR